MPCYPELISAAKGTIGKVLSVEPGVVRPATHGRVFASSKNDTMHWCMLVPANLTVQFSAEPMLHLLVPILKSSVEPSSD